MLYRSCIKSVPENIYQAHTHLVSSPLFQIATLHQCSYSYSPSLSIISKTYSVSLDFIQHFQHHNQYTSQTTVTILLTPCLYSFITFCYHTGYKFYQKCIKTNNNSFSSNSYVSCIYILYLLCNN